ncbi:Lrp/AsnC family transcriptional regulator [Cellulomonas sp. NPDC089187]|uniref:Lrp/AsnC family transcriptional regulator n=1 Tax=Cellulomonas sp. NPDC089187 TaxID=3154970 RepID=UPI00342963E2
MSLDLDAIDSALVRTLQSDAGISNKDLAAATGIAPSTALERVRGLFRRGVLRRRTVEVDLPSLGRGLQAMVSIRLRPPNRQVIEEFTRFLADLPEIIALFTLTGSEDFLLHVAVRDVDQLNAFILDTLTVRREIADVRTSIVFQYRRRPVIEPLP